MLAQTEPYSSPRSSVIDLPVVSVIIPVRNEEKTIHACLDALEKSDYPHDRMEVLLVDGMSEDRTRELAQQFASNGWRFRILTNAKCSRAAGLNQGIREARGQVIMRVDARSLIPCDYVRRCVETLLATGADNVGGVQKPLPTAPMQEAIGIAMSTPFGVGNAQFRLGKRSGPVDTVYLGCFRREVFDRVGVFDDEAAIISEDSDLNQRIRESGGKVYLDASLEVRYRPRETLCELARLYFRYGGARMGNLLKCGKLTSWRQVAPPAFLALLAVSALGSLFISGSRLVFLTALGVYLISDLAVSAVLTRGRNPALFPRLAAAFPCMHFSWACGFLRRFLQKPKPGTEWAF